MTTADPLAGFARSTATYLGTTREVHTVGEGPGVVVVHEMPGITPAVAELGRRVAATGLTAVLPSLFGTPGRPPSTPYILREMSRACVSREFACWATGRSSPATEWLRALARDVHRQHGGPGVGAVGMCFTGGFALAMALDEEMVAPVLSQPSLPFALGARRARDVGLAAPDLRRVRDRAEDDDLCVLGLRFTADRAVPPARFQRLREELDDRFLAVEIDSSPGNPHGIRRGAHSVLTEDLVDEPGHPTRQALDRVLAFLGERLGTAGGPPDGAP